MTILEAIEQRHSVRKYTSRPIESEKLAILQAIADDSNASLGLNIQIVTNDSVPFSSTLARYGRFRGVQNYIAMVGPESDKLNEIVGYEGEKLVLKAQQLGLNTCWAVLTYRKNLERIRVGKDEKIAALIALGYGEDNGSGHKIKRFEQIAHAKSPIPDWFRRGVEAALLAPTAINQQKFSFTLNADGSVTAKAGWGYYSDMDLGIVKLHFEIGSGKANYFYKNTKQLASY